MLPLAVAVEVEACFLLAVTLEVLLVLNLLEHFEDESFVGANIAIAIFFGILQEDSFFGSGVASVGAFLQESFESVGDMWFFMVEPMESEITALGFIIDCGDSLAIPIEC